MPRWRLHITRQLGRDEGGTGALVAWPDIAEASQASYPLADAAGRVGPGEGLGDAGG